MNNEQLKSLCLSLMHADTEAEVIAILTEAGFWNNRDAWRYYGDYEGNYNTIGNQQSRPDAALVEKLINSVDARLMNECLVRGIDPEGPCAPQGIQEAVAHFFDEDTNPNSIRAGRIREWPNDKRTRVARGITLAATGATAKAGKPCFTISDCGEGQTPETMPDTLLSLVTKSNKLRVPFVQGKFNMGSTGVLNFCGRNNLQLILTRRNPAITSRSLSHPSDSQWGFTIVRRENPEGGRRSSVYTYLAPVGAEVAPNRGGVLRFSAERMPIFPDGRAPYTRESEWGTLIKLYEYSAIGFKSNILMRDGLLSRMDILLPDVALPIRFHECRDYRGHSGSFETSLTGISVRLEDDKAENLEFSSSSSMSAAGEQMTATIYAFKKGRAETYRKNEGIIFTLNGQTHGHFTRDFFTRKDAGRLNYIADSILVLVDCSKFSPRAREDLFMNSRDRLSGGDLRLEIEHALEDLLKNHQGLRDLKEQRRREEIASRLEDSKPLKDTLESLLKRSPALSALFQQGMRISTPFKTSKARAEEAPFKGKQYPTYFRFRGKEYGTKLSRDCAINMRCRIAFETDVVDDYFSRDVDYGECIVFRVVGNTHIPVDNYVMHLQNGIATLSVQLPDNCREGDILEFVCIVADPTQIQPFENFFTISVRSAIEPSGGTRERRKPLSDGQGAIREVASGIDLPEIIKVEEHEWSQYNPPFDQYTALRVKASGSSGDSSDNGNGHDVYDFFVNVDNIFLKSELKANSHNPTLTRTQFIYGQVLLGLALLHEEVRARKTKQMAEEVDETYGNGESSIEPLIERFSKAIAPFLLPVIQSLGTLDIEDTPAIDNSGEAT